MIQTKAAAAAIVCLLVSLPAGATYNATATGTVAYVQQDSPAMGYAPETFTFTITNQPSVACGAFHYFIISPNSIPDAQTRKNMVALVLEAKATGGQIEVAYDSTGGYCDQGMIGVYYVVEL